MKASNYRSQAVSSRLEPGIVHPAYTLAAKAYLARLKKEAFLKQANENAIQDKEVRRLRRIRDAKKRAEATAKAA